MSSLELADLEQIVGTVTREYERLRGGRKRFKIGAFQRVTFLLLQIVAYSFPIALALLLLGVFFLGWGGSVQALLLLAWLVLAFVMLLPLTLLNLPLIVSAWRQRRPIIGRDLLVDTFPSWQLQARWVVVTVTAAAGVLAVTVDAFGWTGFIVVLVVVTFPFLLLMLRSFLKLAERNLGLLRDVEELREVLELKLDEARRTSSTKVDLPHALAVKVSETAKGLLGNQRLQAIDDSMRAPSSEYSVAQSATFRERLGQFEPATRLRLLDTVQELAADRQPTGSRLDEASGLWIWALAEPEIELVYEIDDEEHRISVRDVRPLPPPGGGESDASG